MTLNHINRKTNTMRVPATVFATLFTLSTMVASHASGEEWTPKQQGKERSDINTYVRTVSDTPIKQFRGVVEIQHSMVAALSEGRTFHWR